MGKKRNTRRDDAEDIPRKRVKIIHEAATWEDIHSSRQLQQLLTFDQDLKRARHGLQSFKVLLDTILGQDDEKKNEREEKRSILLQYLESSKPRDEEGEESPTYLTDVMETWSFGGRVNNDHIMSTVPVVLDLLLKVLSNALELVPLGLRICRTLLQKRQLELIARNLSAEKNKEFIISPTLRMLREALCFDGGAIAKPMFRARVSTFKSLARNMGVKYIGDGSEELKRPSARTNAVRFYLSAIKFLHPEAKKELLFQRDIVGALTRSIKEDPPYVVLEILNGLKKDVLLDDKVSRDAKSKLLNAGTLSRIGSLYAYDLPQSAESGGQPIQEAAHEFLVLACTKPSSGVLRKESGFYPTEIDQEDVSVLGSDALDGLGLENITWMNKFKDQVPVRNVVLSEFIQTLRPWSSVKHSELLTAVFRVAPELVANYFLSKKTFTFDPKLSATWIGYAAFLFNVVTLPLPRFFGLESGYPRLPPPPSLVIDNILPLPLNQKALSRCLTSKSNLISFFATRILVVGIEKLKEAVAMHQDPPHSNPSLWAEAGRRLIDEFCQRSPSFQDMINAFRSIPEDDILHGEAASRLLRLYYEVIPQVALTAKFDVSPFLDTAVAKLSEREGGDSRDHALSLVRLENLLAVARSSPGMRWFSKSEALKLAPFTAFLKVYIEAPKGVSLDTLLEVLNMVAKEEGVVPSEPSHPGLLPLLESLQKLRERDASYLQEIWTFLDECLSRFVTAPIKYIETIHELKGKMGGSENSERLEAATMSPIIIVMLKQLAFASDEGISALARFLPTYVGLSILGGEDRGLLESVLGEMAGTVRADGKPTAKKLTQMSVPSKLKFKHYQLPPQHGTQRREKTAAQEAKVSKKQHPAPALADDTLEDMLAVRDSLAPDNSALTKWVTKTVDELMDDGYTTSLISLLASEHTSIRKEALTSILKLAAKVKESDYDEKDQVWLLLAELAETAKGAVDTAALPGPTVAFARHAFEVLKIPIHPLYEKVNVFLTRGPVWSLDKVPLVHEILLEEPSVDDSYYATINWMLAYLVDSLRTTEDLQLFHKRRMMGPILERILALAGNPYLRTPLRMQILRVLYRASGIEGGSTTLATRFGIVSWLEEQRSLCKEAEEARAYSALMRRIWQSCDQDRVGTWSRGAVEGFCSEQTA